MYRLKEYAAESAQRGFDEEHVDGDWLVVTLVPGYIEAAASRKWGAPVLVGTGLPTYVGRGWVWDELDRRGERDGGLTREEIIALAAFDAGVEWQRGRTRRQRMRAAVNAAWEKANGITR